MRRDAAPLLGDTPRLAPSTDPLGRRIAQNPQLRHDKRRGSRHRKDELGRRICRTGAATAGGRSGGRPEAIPSSAELAVPLPDAVLVAPPRASSPLTTVPQAPVAPVTPPRRSVMESAMTPVAQRSWQGSHGDRGTLESVYHKLHEAQSKLGKAHELLEAKDANVHISHEALMLREKDLVRQLADLQTQHTALLQEHSDLRRQYEEQKNECMRMKRILSNPWARKRPT